ncbi:MAG: Trk system potassium transporter TrkA [Oscillospiraceae bacterium]|nr:Trk system potassium transporter TrkA [Oscillospiraceae bacterium]
MEIIVVGCGKVGRTIAEQLNDDDNNVTVIDTDPDMVRDISESCDIMGITGNGATHSVQQQAGIERADLLIAVTGSDELNLLCCLIARKAGNCQTIARVRSPEYNGEASFFREELGLAMVINPEFAAAAEIARILRFPSAITIDSFAKGKIDLMKFHIPDDSPLLKYSVKEISTELHCDVLICTIERDGEAIIANGDTTFMKKDVISVVASPKNAYKFFSEIRYKTHRVKNTMIVGAGDIAYYLSQILLKSGIDVKIIEKDPARCTEFCGMVPGATVICADASEQSTLLEEGLENTDSFVALTNLDEENILLTLFAKSKSDCKLITKINRIDFDDVIHKLDLDAIIYPKHITAEYIVRYVRAMKNTIGSNVETLYSVIKGSVEASEFIVKEKSEITDTPLFELKLKKNLLIAGIIRGGKVIIPRGHDTIQVGDSVVIVTMQKGLHDVCDILA